jgi:hypothetical protein
VIGRRGLFGMLLGASVFPAVAKAKPCLTVNEMANFQDAARMYAYWNSKAIEIIPLSPKPSFVWADEPSEGFQRLWQEAANRIQARLSETGVRRFSKQPDGRFDSWTRDND